MLTADSIPFTLRLPHLTEGKDCLECTHVARELPGKRLVCWGEWNGKRVFAKIYQHKTRARAHWRREDRGARAHAQRQIITPPLLYSGFIQDHSVYVAVFEAISDSVNARQAFDGMYTDEERLLLFRMLADVLVKLHSSGLVLKDLHLKNFLVKDDLVYTIDGAAIDVAPRPISRSQSLDSLSLLLAQIEPRFDEFLSDVYRAYAESRGWGADSSDVRYLERRLHENRDRRKRDFIKKAYRQCSAFACEKNYNRFTVYGREYQSTGLEEILKDPEQAMSRNETCLKSGNTTTVALTVIGDRRFVIKRYNIKSAWHGLSRAFRRTRASASWRNAHLLRFYGIRGVTPVALIEERVGPVRRTSYFISEYVEGRTAHDLMLSSKVPLDKKRAIANELTRLLKRLERFKITHGDLKATNAIFSDDGPTLMDLDAMRQFSSQYFFRIAHKRDIARFAKNWHGHPEIQGMFRAEVSPRTSCVIRTQTTG